MSAQRAATPERDPLVIREIEFLGPMVTPTGWRPETTLPVVAFAGRSNVGKSSLINRLVHRRKLARVSNTPGRTRQINFFRVNDQFVLADLPGYGYARISRERRQEWRPLIEGYLQQSANLRGIVLLLDARHEPTAEDREMLDFLAELELPTLIAVTKVDKLSPRSVPGRIVELAGTVGLEPDQLIPFSARTGEGRRELAEAVVALVSSATPPRSTP